MFGTDGRVARLTIVDNCDNGGTTEETPAPASTGRGHGRLDGVDMSNVTGIDRKTIALEYLHLAHEDMLRAARLRIERMRLARQYGATHQQIADECGVTESAVRALLNRRGA